MLEDILTRIFDNFDFGYMAAINIMTYIIIKIHDYANGNLKVSTLMKRVWLVTSLVVVTILYLALGYEPNIVLLNSAIAAPVFYSWVLKPILKKIGVGYSDEENIVEDNN